MMVVVTAKMVFEAGGSAIEMVCWSTNGDHTWHVSSTYQTHT